MKKLVATAPRAAELKDYEDRPIQSNEVRVKVEFAAPKHGTELADFRGTTPFIDGKFDNDWKVFVERDADEPRGIEFGDLPIGNMFVGTIIEAGADVTEYAVGDRVCSYGPIRETEIVNAVDNYKLRKMSREASAKNAVCYDPAQFALGGIRDANVRSGDNVVVIGLGAIGQLAVQMAKKSGASIVIAVDPIEKRREIAGKYGADYCFDPTACDVGLEIKRITGKMGADAILETSSSVRVKGAGIRRNYRLSGICKAISGGALAGTGSSLQLRQDRFLESVQRTESGLSEVEQKENRGCGLGYADERIFRLF